MDILAVRLWGTAIVWLVRCQVGCGENYGLTSHSFINLGDSRDSGSGHTASVIFRIQFAFEQLR